MVHPAAMRALTYRRISFNSRRLRESQTPPVDADLREGSRWRILAIKSMEFARIHFTWVRDAWFAQRASLHEHAHYFGVREGSTNSGKVAGRTGLAARRRGAHDSTGPISGAAVPRHDSLSRPDNWRLGTGGADD